MVGRRCWCRWRLRRHGVGAVWPASHQKADGDMQSTPLSAVGSALAAVGCGGRCVQRALQRKRASERQLYANASVNICPERRQSVKRQDKSGVGEVAGVVGARCVSSDLLCAAAIKSPLQIVLVRLWSLCSSSNICTLLLHATQAESGCTKMCTAFRGNVQPTIFIFQQARSRLSAAGLCLAAPFAFQGHPDTHSVPSSFRRQLDISLSQPSRLALR